eukprot:GILK01009701.1.p1 GENE.GILK01009701.1~~GILK01009701.1.p1  ORF type:complete len:210 (+),score=61.54 GILK01009701.1:45-674(+)
MVKKGLSFDEKRDRIIKIFFDKKEVFNLKELEKLGAKEGVVLQTVKEVVQSLVDDNLVQQDKIGSANFFWALPSTAVQTRKVKIDALEADVEKLKAEKSALLKRKREATEDRQDSDERAAKLQRLAELQKEQAALNKELEQYRKNDPETVNKLTSEAKIAWESANRWTDNICVVKRWILDKQPGMSESDLNKHFEIPNELDTLDWKIKL